MNGLSLFANVGIAETYLNSVGVDIVIANELLPSELNFTSTYILTVKWCAEILQQKKFIIK